MKKQKIISAITAAAIAVGSMALSSAIFAENASYEQTEYDSVSVTGTAVYTFDGAYFVTGSHTVGYTYYEDDYGVGNWVENGDEALEGITTIDDFVSKYGSLELKFSAANMARTSDKPIEEIVEEAEPNSTAAIEVAPEDTVIKAEAFEAAKENNITLSLTLDNGVKWVIKAETIGNGVIDVNINVELNTSNVPAASIDAVAEGKSTMQISLAHNGSFGFEANITIPVAPENNGSVANLFHYNNGALEFVASATVSNGEATLPFSHASEYVIVFDDKSMDASETDTNPGTGASGVGNFAILAGVSAAAVIICRRNKHN